MKSEAESAFSRALQADGPSIPQEAQIFAPFIGGWDLVVRWFGDDGRETRSQPGEWHFAWVLEGRGIQDVWIVPPRDRWASGDLYEYGTSIRFYDPHLDAWQSTWIGPMHRVVRTFAARKVGDTVMLETTPDTSPTMRWTFRDITANAFKWVNEIRDENGWRVQQTFEARRRTEDRSETPSPNMAR